MRRLSLPLMGVPDPCPPAMTREHAAESDRAVVYGGEEEGDAKPKNTHGCDETPAAKSGVRKHEPRRSPPPHAVIVCQSPSSCRQAADGE